MTNAVIEDIFTTIYSKNIWGKTDDHAFYSGSGSHDPKIVEPYVQVVRAFMTFFHLIEGRKPTIVDIGCGDFAVGSRFIDQSARYYGLDIVKKLIEYNCTKFKHPELEFIHADVSSSAIPSCDICTVRQVFQHLPNASISASLKNILPYCKFLILTEHLPSDPNFVPNLEIPHTGNWRFSLNSGVDITRSPFDHQFQLSMILNEVEEYGGIVRTNIYRCR